MTKLLKPHLPIEAYESEGKGWSISKRNATPEFLAAMEVFIAERKEMIRRAQIAEATKEEPKKEE